MNIKSDFRKICQLNVSGLAEKVGDLDESAWFEDTSRQKAFEIHKSTQSIRLVDNIAPGKEKAKVHPLYGELKKDISYVLNAIKRDIDPRSRAKKLEKTHGKSCFVRIVLARLNEQSEIPKHNDKGDSLKYVHRVHCPLITNEQCAFLVGDSVQHLEQGEIVEINNRRMHAVSNKSAEKRIHMIVDYYVPGERVLDIDGNVHICKL